MGGGAGGVVAQKLREYIPVFEDLRMAQMITSHHLFSIMNMYMNMPIIYTCF